MKRCIVTVVKNFITIVNMRSDKAFVYGKWLCCERKNPIILFVHGYDIPLLSVRWENALGYTVADI